MGNSLWNILPVSLIYISNPSLFTRLLNVVLSAISFSKKDNIFFLENSNLNEGANSKLFKYLFGNIISSSIIVSLFVNGSVSLKFVAEIFSFDWDGKNFEFF